MVTADHLKLPNMENGFLGVDIFFALSGFLITSILAEEWIKTGQVSLRNFYMRRVLRLYPALLLMLIAVSPITKAYGYIFSGLTYTTNWVMALHLQPINLELGHIWTLAIEEQYYLLWPLTLVFLLKRFPVSKVIQITMGITVLSFLNRIFYWHFNDDFWRYNAGTDTHADGLLLGSVLGLAATFGLIPNQRLLKQGVAILSIPAASLAVYLIYIKPVAGMEEIQVFGSLAVAIITLLAILQVVVFPSRKLLLLLESKPLVFIGTISYGLYLWQVPVINLVDLSMFSLGPLLDGTLKAVLFTGLTLLSYRYLERPIMRFKRRFSPGDH